MSSTNRGAQRRSLDQYYTPPALAEALVSLLELRAEQLVIEPGVGAGSFAEAIARRGCEVLGVDADAQAPWLLQHRGMHADILSTDLIADWYVGNPPFKAAEQHLRHALRRSRVGCAFLLRLAFLESRRRFDFWNSYPASRVYVLSSRPSFTGTGTDSCAYAWFVWRCDQPPHATVLRVLEPRFSAPS